MQNKPPKDDVEMIAYKLQELERQMTELEQTYRPTIPIYNPADLPADAVEGQVAILAS